MSNDLFDPAWKLFVVAISTNLGIRVEFKNHPYLDSFTVFMKLFRIFPELLLFILRVKVLRLPTYYS